MSGLSLERCHNHGQREAAARCRECASYYCRECIAEHEGRLLCASCLTKILAGAPPARLRLPGAIAAGRFSFGFLLLWLVFYSIGRALLQLPASFHEGTMWKQAWWWSK